MSKNHSAQPENEFDESPAERESTARKLAQIALLKKQEQLNTFARIGRTADVRRLRKELVESTQPGTELFGATDDELANRNKRTVKRIQQERAKVDRILGRKTAPDSPAW